MNVRSQATISSSKVATIRAIGTEVEVTARVKNSSGEIWWAVILANGTLGYIRSDLLDTSAVVLVDRNAPVQVTVESYGAYDGWRYEEKDPAPLPQATPTPIIVYVTPTPAPQQAQPEPEVTPQVIYVFQDKENG